MPSPKPNVNKGGRPTNEELATRTAGEVAQKEADKGAQVINRHRADCTRLRAVLKLAESKGEFTPSDMQRLAGSVKTLHELERNAYDMGDKNTKVLAVIHMPAPAEDMASWQKLASKHLPAHAPVTGPDTSKRIEPDIEGTAPEPEECDEAGNVPRGADEEGTT